MFRKIQVLGAISLLCLLQFLFNDFVKADESTRTVSTVDAKETANPAQQLQLYLDAFHFIKEQPKMQMEVHHYCQVLNSDLVQCALYNDNKPDAKLVGIEYVISDKLYSEFSPKEKLLWHPHQYEVTSGQLIAPNLTADKEHELLNMIYHTHGKAWHLWDAWNNQLPIGTPELIWSFTKDGELDPTLLLKRDIKFNISNKDKKAQRKDIPFSMNNK
jgi:hypothetical protein